MKFHIICYTILILLLPGCSSEQLNSTAYNALKDKDCMETHGYPGCHDNQPDYEEYKQQRAETVN